MLPCCPSDLEMIMKINISAKSDVGLERTNNEDAFVFCPDLVMQNWGESLDSYVPVGALGSVAVVADGMGGANAGEMASTIALETIRCRFCRDNLESLSLTDEVIRSFLRDTITAANDAIMQRVGSDPDTIGMGTTIVLLWQIRQKAYIAWCGDSRCYVYNPDYGLKCLSKDHSYVQELVDRGELSAKDVYGHPDSNVITRCLGDTDSPAVPDIVDYDVRMNDTFLLCSDGLCGYCSDKTIERIVARHIHDLDRCTESLVGAALETGGFDNITIVLSSLIADRSVKISDSIWHKLKRIQNSFRR